MQNTGQGVAKGSGRCHSGHGRGSRHPPCLRQVWGRGTTYRTDQGHEEFGIIAAEYCSGCNGRVCIVCHQELGIIAAEYCSGYNGRVCIVCHQELGIIAAEYCSGYNGRVCIVCHQELGIIAAEYILLRIQWKLGYSTMLYGGHCTTGLRFYTEEYSEWVLCLHMQLHGC